MKPNRLLVSKFLGIESLDLVFENDLFVIVGPNGSGKSSILEALFFALYGKSVRAGGKGSLIHRGYPESSLRTELEFTLASHSYRVTREYSLKRGSTASLEERTGERWTTICSGDRGVNQKIEHLLGLDAETYEASVFLPQGETLSFVESTPSGRFAVLSNLFGLGILDTIREQSKSRLDVLEGRLHQLDEQRRVLTDASLEEKLSTAMGQKESLDKKIAECSRVEKETTSLLKGLETLHHSRTELLSTGIKIKNLLPEIERAKKQAEIDRDIQNALFVKATYWQPWETVLEKLTTLQTRNQRTREKKDALFLALNENSRHLQKTVENEKTLRDKLKTLEDYHYQLDTIVRPEVSTLLMLVRDRETWTKEKNRDEVILTGIRKTIEEEKKAWQVLNYHIDQGKGELSVLEKKLLALERIVRETESLYASLSLAEKEKTFFMKELENVQKGIERIQADRELARRTIEKLNQELEHRAIKREKMDVERKEQIRLFATIELQDTWKKTGVCPICGTHTLPDHLRFSHPGGINIIEAEKTHREFEEYWTHLMTEKEKNEEKEKMLSRSEEELTKTRINHQEKIRTLLEQQKGSRDSLQEVFQPLSFPHVPERREIATLLENERRRKDALSSSIHTRERELSGSNEKRAALSEREKELSLALEERSQKITGADQLVQEKRTHITLLLQEMNLSLRTDFLPENAFQHYWERCLRSFNTASGEMTRTTSEIESLRAQITMQEKSLTELQNDINMCTNEVETLSAQEQALQSVFLQEVQKYGFSKESFLSLKDRQPGGWSERLNRMEGEWKQLQSREEELQKECSELSSRLHVPLNEVETILLREKNSLEELQRDLAESRKTAGSLESEIKYFTGRIEEKKRLEEDARTLRQERDLHLELKGALEAKGFKNYLLAFLLRELEKEASDILGDLSRERYALQVKMNRGATDIAVIDSWYGWQERLPGDCSGGEKTLIALSLALALSRIRLRGSGTIRNFDCLFIDEGFSPLDRDHLELVADAITHLARYGRMVGVVTHDPQFAQFFPVYLEVKDGKATWKKNPDVQ